MLVLYVDSSHVLATMIYESAFCYQFIEIKSLKDKFSTKGKYDLLHKAQNCYFESSKS